MNPIEKAWAVLKNEEWDSEGMTWSSNDPRYHDTVMSRGMEHCANCGSKVGKCECPCRVCGNPISEDDTCECPARGQDECIDCGKSIVDEYPDGEIPRSPRCMTCDSINQMKDTWDD